ncbi:hypothetical protein NKI09_05080 [Mesorhizobium sp. M0757]|uniref:hypothetical protein n=1 Tax=Mesorhizobium sp. M0757 TaxID=2956993 RepID=UPI003336C310
MKNPRKPSAEPIQTVSRDQGESSQTSIVLPSHPQLLQSDIESVLAELDAVGSTGDGGGVHYGVEDDIDESEEYDRTIWIKFPEEIRALYFLGDIEIPIRRLLKWAAAELPDDATTINEIREEYYGGDQSEDHDFGVSEFCFRNPPPTIEQTAIKRVARAAGREERGARRLCFEIAQAEQAIRDSAWQIDQLEGRSTPLDTHMEKCNKDRVEIGEMYGELHDAWDKFVAERQDKNDPEFDTSTRAKLMTWEQNIGDISTKRRIVRDAEFKALMAEKTSATEFRSPE